MKTYRPISFLSVGCEVLGKIIANRITATLNFNQPRHQAGFRTGYSTIDHVHTTNQVTEKCVEFNQPLYAAFTDHKETIDSAKQLAVMPALLNQGVDGPGINILKDINRSAKPS